jgi:putative ABC transport system substrate-binding protein
MEGFGYVDGQNLVIEHRVPAPGERLARYSEAARELIALPVDVIVAANVPSVRGARAVTSSVPIVASGGGGVGDLVANELVASLARSDNNVTGLTVPNTVAGKRLQLLVEAVPQARRVAVLHEPPDSAPQIGELERAAGQLDVTLLPVAVETHNDLEAAFGQAVRQQAGSLFVVTGGVVAERNDQVADLALRHRLPSMWDTRAVSAGALMYYGPNFTEQYRRTAYFVDRILKGAKPADLPVEQPMRFDFVVNMKTARELGITFPHEILLQVTEAIE